MPDNLTLDELRGQIDEIDSALLELFNKRGALAKQIANVKDSDSVDGTFYCPDREAQLLRNIIEKNTGPLSNQAVVHLFRELISACLILEQALTIAYLGPEGTFTQTAAIKHFGGLTKMLPMSGIDQVFQEVESGRCHYGVVPVENSIEGMVNHTLDMLIDSSLLICGEIELGIHHNLLADKDCKIKDISQIYSHQQSLAQCRIWLDRHLPGAERVAVNSSAEGARIAKMQDSSAAIAAESAARIYSLSVLAANIEDASNNMTRFLVLGRHEISPSGKDKTSLLFTTPNKAGALHEMLACFSDNGVSLNRIESRPLHKGMWEYIFFVDIDGHVDEAIVALALDKLNERADMVKLLGSYPRSLS